MDSSADNTLTAAQQINANHAIGKRMQMKCLHATLLSALMACATLSHAAGTDRSDRRGEGKVEGKIAAKFHSVDRDGDGALNREEAEAGGLKPVAKHFHRLDTDRDGKVTREEIRSLLRSRAGHAQESGTASVARQ